MKTQMKNNGGLLVCGACAVPAYSDSTAVTSIDLMVNAVKRILKSA